MTGSTPPLPPGYRLEQQPQTGSAPDLSILANDTTVTNPLDARILSNIKALPAALNPIPQTKAETGMALMGLPAPVTRMVSGILEGLGITSNIQGGGAGPGGIPGAIRDINASPNPREHYQQAAIDTAGDALTLAALDAAGKGLSKYIPERLTGPKGTAGPEPTGNEAAQAPASSSQPPATQAPAPYVTDAKAIKARLNELLNPPTDAETLKSRLDEVNAPTDGQTIKDRLADINNPTDAATLKRRLGEVSYIEQAAKEVGPNATIEDVTKAAKDLRNQSSQFEKVFGQPLENYKTPDGTFQMRDFLQEVVKPGTEPPAHVISRVFGSDGVKLIQDISGKPIDKWEATGPTKAERAAGKLTPAPQNEPAPTPAPQSLQTGTAPGPGGTPSSEVDPAKGDRVITGDPARYLRMSGSSARTILETPEDVKAVNYFRKQIREGKPVPPPEIYMDKSNNVIEADGRHRALAYQLEGVNKIKIIKRGSPLQGVQR